MVEKILSSFSWQFWFTMLFLFFIFLWLFYGNDKHNFVGVGQHGAEDGTSTVDRAISKLIKERVNKDESGDISAFEEEFSMEIINEPRDEKEDTESTVVIDNTPNIPDEVFNGPPEPIKGSRRTSKPEEYCRKVLESLFHLPFPSARPEFLRNPESKRCLELDCYNESLGLAVEYNGRQHYVYPNQTGQSYQAFLSQIRRDLFKVEQCDANNVYLITVPYTCPIDRIRNYIMEYLPEELRDQIQT